MRERRSRLRTWEGERKADANGPPVQGSELQSKVQCFQQKRMPHLYPVHGKTREGVRVEGLVVLLVHPEGDSEEVPLARLVPLVEPEGIVQLCSPWLYRR